MHNGQSIYQTKYCNVRPRFLPSTPSLLNAQSSSNGQNSTRRKSQPGPTLAGAGPNAWPERGAQRKT